MISLYGLALVLVAIAIPSHAQPASRVPETLFTSIDAHTPGLTILVARGDKVLYQHAAGGADLEQGVLLTPETRFHVASVSKQFTSAAVLLLAREGKLRMDAPVRTYLPELPEAYSAITVIQLLNHTSGLRDQWDLVRASGASMSDYIRQDRLFALVQAQRSLNFVPGTEFRYSNSGYMLAAEIVARISGIPFARFIDERLFRPLGMTKSLVYADAGVPIVNRAQSYTVDVGSGVRLSRLNFNNYGATSVFSTAGDLYRWSRELLHPHVLDASIVAAMIKPTRLSDGTISKYGLGLYRTQTRGHDTISHGGSDAGFRALIAVHPLDDAAIIVLSNGSADVVGLHEKLVDAFLNETPSVDEIAAPDGETLTPLTGYYVSSWGPGFELALREGKLERQVAGGPAQPAIFEKKGTFRFINPAMRLAPVSVGVLQQVSSSDPPVEFHRTVRVTPSADELQSLVGRYRSEELDHTVSILLRAGRAEMSSARQPEPVALFPADQDRFDTGNGRIRIERDVAGHVTGFTLTMSRTRNIRFSRVTA